MRIETLKQLNQIVKEQKTEPDEVYVEYDDRFSLIWKVKK